MNGLIDETWECGAGGVVDAVQRLTRAEADDDLDRAVRAGVQGTMEPDPALGRRAPLLSRHFTSRAVGNQERADAGPVIGAQRCEQGFSTSSRRLPLDLVPLFPEPHDGPTGPLTSREFDALRALNAQKLAPRQVDLQDDLYERQADE